MAPELIREAVVSSDLLFLPTAGENFGHAIQEALAAGCPVLISDRTRWRDLAPKGVGWDLPLSAPDRFVAVLREDGRHGQRGVSTDVRERVSLRPRNPLLIQHRRFHEAFISGAHLFAGLDLRFRSAAVSFPTT